MGYCNAGLKFNMKVSLPMGACSGDYGTLLASLINSDVVMIVCYHIFVPCRYSSKLPFFPT